MEKLKRKDLRDIKEILIGYLEINIKRISRKNLGKCLGSIPTEVLSFLCGRHVFCITLLILKTTLSDGYFYYSHVMKETKA